MKDREWYERQRTIKADRVQSTRSGYDVSRPPQPVRNDYRYVKATAPMLYRRVVEIATATQITVERHPLTLAAKVETLVMSLVADMLEDQQQQEEG